MMRSDEPFRGWHVLAEDWEPERCEGVCAGHAAAGLADPLPRRFGDHHRPVARHRAQHPRLPAPAFEVLDQPRPFVENAADRLTQLNPAGERSGDFAEAPRPGWIALTWLDHRNRRLVSRPGRGHRPADQVPQDFLAVTTLLRPPGRQQPLQVRHVKPARAVALSDRQRAGLLAVLARPRRPGNDARQARRWLCGHVNDQDALAIPAIDPVHSHIQRRRFDSAEQLAVPVKVD